MNNYVFVFHEKTPNQVKNVLNRLFQTRERIRVWYGDIDTGKAWPEEYDVLGVVGRSTGTKPIPLLVYNSRSTGGPGLLDHCIVRIDTTVGKTLYKHPTFNDGITVDGFSVLSHGSIHAVCKTGSQARRLASFFKGERYSK